MMDGTLRSLEYMRTADEVVYGYGDQKGTCCGDVVGDMKEFGSDEEEYEIKGEGGDADDCIAQKPLHRRLL